MESDREMPPQIVIKETDIKGEKIIFDIPIKEKLAHVIVIKEDNNYHINLDGEDLGSFSKEEDGKIRHYEQPKGANTNLEEYFKSIEEKLKELSK